MDSDGDGQSVHPVFAFHVQSLVLYVLAGHVLHVTQVGTTLSVQPALA